MATSEDMKKVGEILRARRNEMNMSIKEAENATSIRANHLEAIEQGRSDEHLSSIYVNGFMKQYANHLGLDVSKLKTEFPNAFKVKPEKHEFDYGIGTLEMRGSVNGGVKWFPNLLWAGISVVVLVIAYYFAKYVGVV
jgi:cytoskeletal protein RodZ